jgi:Flp pilus assembly protein TadD
LPAAGAERSLSDCLTMADAPATDIASLERCHDLVPDDVELAADLGRAYEKAGRKDDAVAVYRGVIALDPTHADVRIRLAHLLLDHGDRSGAREQVEAALRIQPGRPSFLALAKRLEP